MTRVVACSRNTALPFALSTAGHDVVVVPAEDDVRWSEYTAFGEVVVLDVDDPVTCHTLIDGIAQSARSTDHEVRVLCLAGDASAWDDLVSRTGVSVLHLPLTMPRLESAIDELREGPALPAAERIVIDVRDPMAVAPTSVASPDVARRVIVHAEPDAVVPAPARPADPIVQVEPPTPRLLSLVRTLTASVPDLATVPETAQVVLEAAMELLPSDAGCVIVRDGFVWRVAAGEGLRSREDRLTLSPQHWLVDQTSGSVGIVLTGGEGRWPQLYGVPLSWRKNLLAAPLPPAGAFLVLARDTEEYAEQDLQSVLPFSDEAGHLLIDAIDVRKLARKLEGFVDVAD